MYKKLINSLKIYFLIITITIIFYYINYKNKDIYTGKANFFSDNTFLFSIPKYQVFILTISTSFFLLYLIGTIPFGLILGRLLAKKDVRSLGSGNIGATNVLRTGNKIAALLTLLGDGFKGFFPSFFWTALFGAPLSYDNIHNLDAFAEITFYLYLPLLAPILGHVFPCWLNFKGGKGVATALGVILGIDWPLGLGTIVIWLITASLSRISSLSALVAFILCPLGGWYFYSWAMAFFCSLITLLLLWTHRGNIRRLMKGEEKALGTTGDGTS